MLMKHSRQRKANTVQFYLSVELKKKKTNEQSQLRPINTVKELMVAGARVGHGQNGKGRRSSRLPVRERVRQEEGKV